MGQPDVIIPAFIELDDLSKSFGGMLAVDRVSLSIRKGEFFSLLGASGCGKTTLMRMIAGFETPDRGAVRIDGQDISRLAPHQRPINMMFQNYALFPHMSVEANIAFGLRRQGLENDAVRHRTAEMMALVQLDGLGSRKPDQLSGGQKQRVALARALARNPKVLLLDEPLAALDKKLRKETQSELKRIQKESGATFIVVTHDQEEAMALSDRLAIMRKGRVEQIGIPHEVYASPASHYVAGFMGEANFLPVLSVCEDVGRLAVTVEGIENPIHLSKAASMGACLKPAAANFSLCLRPERLTLAAHPDASCDCWFSGTVTERIHLGASVVYHVETGNGMNWRVTSPVDAMHPGWSTGTPLHVGFRAVDVCLLGNHHE